MFKKMLTILEYLHSSDPFRHLATHPMPWFLTDQICAIRQLILANFFCRENVKVILCVNVQLHQLFRTHTELTHTQTHRTDVSV